MADGTDNGGRSDNGKRGKPLSDDAALSARLGRLDQRLSTIEHSRKVGADNRQRQGEDAAARASAMARGIRLSSELVAGVAVGAALGWAFDYLLSTSPWGFIVFFLLGFAAGVINLMRVAGVVPDVNERLKTPPGDQD
ncbi:MAG TPA: AtpZ/AtpI family protein [Xanthobacteraceae bacterium]|nr:AtpZ/AtpI family protein [Xanthobacteraceae bacterium]